MIVLDADWPPQWSRRGDLVKRLLGQLSRLEWEYGGDKDLEFHLDGQLAHGAERVAPALVRQMGYRVVYR